MIRDAQHDRVALDAHNQLCAAVDSDDCCEMCGRIASTQITDAEGYWVCGECAADECREVQS